MDRNAITQILLERADRLKAIGATSLYMFGSRARGDNRPDSDLDLFIEYQESKKLPSLLDIIGFELDFLELTGIPTHLTTRDSFHPVMAKKIEKEALRVF